MDRSIKDTYLFIYSLDAAYYWFFDDFENMLDRIEVKIINRDILWSVVNE